MDGFGLTDKHYAVILKQILEQYKAIQIPRGCGKSIIPHIMQIMALNRAIEVLEEKGEK